MRKNKGYSEQQITQEDVNRLNQEERERVAGADNLFNAILKAENGDTSELDKQMYIKYSLHGNSLHGDVRFTEGRINNLAIRMKKKYADDEMIGGESVSIGSGKYSVMIDKKFLDAEEVDAALINLVFNFNERLLEITEDVPYTVLCVHSFKGETEVHSNNKLMSYIIGTDRKIGVFEAVLLKIIENKKGTARHMKDGKTSYVNLNDLEIFGYEDISTPENEDGKKVKIDDILGESDNNFIDEDEHEVFHPSREMLFMKANIENVLTKNQVSKFNEIIKALENKQTTFDKLLHVVTNEFIYAELGEIWYGRRNNVSGDVKKLLRSMRGRMNNAIQLQNFQGESELLSSYRKLKNHSKKQNRLLNEYKILDKYVIKDIKIDEFHANINIKVKNDEQFIPYEEIEKIERHEQTVNDVIRKYQITKKGANNPNGSVKRYVIDQENGEPLFTDGEIKRREDKHCRRLLECIRYGDIAFIYDEDTNMMQPTSHKLHSIIPEEYYNLVERPLFHMDDKKEIEIVRNNLNRDYFNIDNKYMLAEEYRVDLGEKIHFDLREYDYKSTDFIEETEVINIDTLVEILPENINNTV